VRVLSASARLGRASWFWPLNRRAYKPTVTVATQWDPGVKELAQIADANGVALIVRLVPIVDTVKTDYEPRPEVVEYSAAQLSASDRHSSRNSLLQS
jgi:hypothetical protein